MADVRPSPEKCFSGSDEDCDGSNLCSNEPERLASFPTQPAANGAVLSVKGIATRGGDGFLVARFSGTIQANGGTITGDTWGDILVIHFDARGELVWLRTYGGPGYHDPKAAVLLNNGNLLLGGAFGLMGQSATFTFDAGTLGPMTSAQKDGYLLEVAAASGAPIAFHRLQDDAGAADQDVSAVALDPTGQYAYVLGSYAGATTLGGSALPPTTAANDSDVVLIKFDLSSPDSGHAFHRIGASSVSDHAGGVAVSPAGAVLVTGYTNATAPGTQISIDAGVSAALQGGGDHWRATFAPSFNATSLSVDGDSSSPETAIAVSAVAGAEEFNVLFSPGGAALQAEGGCAFLQTGSLSGVVGRYSATNGCLWRRKIEFGGGMGPRSIGGGQPVVVGNYRVKLAIDGNNLTSNDGGEDGFLLLLDANGASRGVATVGGEGVESLDVVWMGTDGGWAAGRSNEAFTFSGQLADGGGQSGEYPFLLRLSP